MFRIDDRAGNVMTTVAIFLVGAQHQNSIASVFERGAASVAYIATRSLWLLAVPILAIFILRDGCQFAGGFARVADVGRDNGVVERILSAD